MAVARISSGVSPPPTIHNSRKCCSGRGGSQLCERLSAFVPCQAGLCLPQWSLVLGQNSSAFWLHRF